LPWADNIDADAVLGEFQSYHFAGNLSCFEQECRCAGIKMRVPLTDDVMITEPPAFGGGTVTVKTSLRDFKVSSGASSSKCPDT